MASNGKGNGKHGGGSSGPPAQSDGATNGKAKGVVVVVAGEAAAVELTMPFPVQSGPPELYPTIICCRMEAMGEPAEE